MELETLQNNIWEEYELTYTKCLEYKSDISNYSNPNKAIGEVKAKIHSLGTINVGAIEEYIKVKERYEFLTNQKNDLEEAEKSLRKIIGDMLQLMKKQFLEQFEIINTNFNEVFKELFGGGRAHLKLTDPENVLECGIEIEAQPPGKKLQNLMLLSGGERALTAIAILFSMLRVRPTPFCIFDEIEAALDDINVYRFAEYVRKFSHNTQFLVITHRRGTMEVADALYGVTMQEHGISKLMSVKLSEQVG
jgi:chromosome segregation protein